MEFVTSRTMMMLCGTVLMMAILTPMSQMTDMDTENRVSGIAEADAAAIDSFYDSGLDTLKVRGDALLPSPGYHLTAEGHVLTITSSDGRKHTAALLHPVENMEICYTDTVTLIRTEEGTTAAG